MGGSKIMIPGLWDGGRGSPRLFQGGSRGQEHFYNNTKTFCSIHFVDICTDNAKAKTGKTAGASTQINEVLSLIPTYLLFNKSPASHKNIHDGVIVNFIKIWPLSTHLVNSLCAKHFRYILKSWTHLHGCLHWELNYLLFLWNIIFIRKSNWQTVIIQLGIWQTFSRKWMKWACHIK